MYHFWGTQYMYGASILEQLVSVCVVGHLNLLLKKTTTTAWEFTS